MKAFDGKNAVVFFDFDNTITNCDVFDDILLKFSKDSRWRILEERWKNKEIGSRRCLEGQVKTIRITQTALDKYLGTVKLDPHFKHLVRFLRARRVKTVVLSDNFDYILSRILRKNGFRNLRIYSNKAEFSGDRLIPKFPFADKKCRLCAHCKKNNLLSNVNSRPLTIYIGDGLSDACPARYAGKVFAKDSLLDYCKKEGIPHVPYKNLKEVHDYIKKEYKNGQK